MGKILIVEDEVIIRTALRSLLERNGYEALESGCVDDAMQLYNADQNNKDQAIDLIISDLRLPGNPGTDIIDRVNIPVLIMTSYASLRSAVDTMKMGAAEYIAKPFDHSEMLSCVKRLLNIRKSQTNTTNRPVNPAIGSSVAAVSTPASNGSQSQNPADQLVPTSIPLTEMIGNCPKMQEIFSFIKKVAPTDTTVLIQGESGTGKELAARAIHDNSNRRHRVMVSVNCASISTNSIETELFGHAGGKDGMPKRSGMVESAENGTLFLDEVDELSLEAQAMLLNLIQDKEYRAVGSVHTKKANIRLIIATHRDLKSLADEEKFRQDLYYRINVMPMTLPPLRERGDDVIKLADNILETMAQKYNKPQLTFTESAAKAICSHQWPGNIRELENAIERAVILCDQNTIDTHLLDLSNKTTSAPQTGSTKENLSLEGYFQQFILEHEDHMSETELAQRLGVSRKCLWERRQRYGIPRKKSNSNNAKSG